MQVLFPCDYNWFSKWACCNTGWTDHIPTQQLQPDLWMGQSPAPMRGPVPEAARNCAELLALRGGHTLCIGAYHCISLFASEKLEHHSHILYVFREYIVIPDIYIHLYTVCGQMPPFSHIAFLLKGFLCGLHSLQVLTPQTFHKWHKRIHFPQGQPNQRAPSCVPCLWPFLIVTKSAFCADDFTEEMVDWIMSPGKN